MAVKNEAKRLDRVRRRFAAMVGLKADDKRIMTWGPSPHPRHHAGVRLIEGGASRWGWSEDSPEAALRDLERKVRDEAKWRLFALAEALDYDVAPKRRARRAAKRGSR